MRKYAYNTPAEIEAAKERSREAALRAWMPAREIDRRLAALNPGLSPQTYCWHHLKSTVGRDVARLLKEPLPPSLKHYQKYNRAQVCILLHGGAIADTHREWLHRAAEADATGDWLTIHEVRDILAPCNPRWENVNYLCSSLATPKWRRLIRRLFDAREEKTPNGRLCLQRYLREDVLAVADTYKVREWEYRFPQGDEPPAHTWLPISDIARILGTGRQRLVDMALSGHLQCVAMRCRDSSGGRLQLQLLADFCAARELCCWRPAPYARKRMGAAWVQARLRWQQDNNLQPPFVYEDDTISSYRYEVYCPELINPQKNISPFD